MQKELIEVLGVFLSWTYRGIQGSKDVGLHRLLEDP